MSEEKSKQASESLLVELVKNPLLLVVLGLVGGGGIGTTAAVGVDWFGLQAMRDDIEDVEDKLELDSQEIGRLSRVAESLSEEQERARGERLELDAILRRLDKNMFILCQQTAGARCLPDE